MVCRTTGSPTARRSRVTNFPTIGGKRIALQIATQGRRITLTLHGAHGSVSFELPALVNDIASTTAGQIDQAGRTVQLDAGVRTVTVALRRSPA